MTRAYVSEEKTANMEALLAKLRAGERPLGLGTGMNSTAPIEMARQHGFDWVIVDQEHTLLNGREFIDMLRTAEWGGMPAFVKVNERKSILIRDALDAGAS